MNLSSIIYKISRSAGQTRLLLLGTIKEKTPLSQQRLSRNEPICLERGVTWPYANKVAITLCHMLACASKEYVAQNNQNKQHPH